MKQKVGECVGERAHPRLAILRESKIRIERGRYNICVQEFVRLLDGVLYYLLFYCFFEIFLTFYFYYLCFHIEKALCSQTNIQIIMTGECVKITAEMMHASETSTYKIMKYEIRTSPYGKNYRSDNSYYSELEVTIYGQ